MTLLQSLPNDRPDPTQAGADLIQCVTTRDGPERVGEVLVISPEIETGYIIEDNTHRRFDFARKWIGADLFDMLAVGRRVKFFHNGHNCAIDITPV